MSVLDIADIALLGASFNGRARIKDSAARELAKRTKDDAKREALEAAKRRAERFVNYTDYQSERISSLRAVHWPRARAIRGMRAEARSIISAHFDVYDDSVSLSQAELYDAIRREYRLDILLSRAYAASAAIGAFPLSRADMRTDKRTAFIGSAANRHFTFKGGRDIGTLLIDPADIVQGAFIRAIDNGDTVNGVPTYGSMFRHIQSERAQLTRLANLEYVSARDAALGHVSRISEQWPDVADKHSMRLLGTRNYATLSDHRLSLAIAHRDAELETLDDAVSASARSSVIDNGNQREFHIVLARVLQNGASLADVADAMGLRVATIKERAIKSAHDSMRDTSTGIDHSERSVDMARDAERERDIDNAQREHAELLRARRVALETRAYAMTR